ncbi:MAG: ThiF family adenylyltransferase, partial [Candidatus Pacearchaeota archaeon]
GTGRIGIVDHDVISISNLHRQIIYTEKHAGTYKTKVTSEFLSELNPFVEVEQYYYRLVMYVNYQIFPDI